MRREKSILLLVIILFIALLIVFATSIGYAAQNDNLLINDNSEYSNGREFEVVFSGEPKYKGNGYAELEITGPTIANFNISKLKKVGDFVTVIFELENKSNDLDANINVNVTNTNTEYFKVTSRIENKILSSRNGKTNAEVEVELIKLPINEDQKSNISIKISAEPIE